MHVGEIPSSVIAVCLRVPQGDLPGIMTPVCCTVVCCVFSVLSSGHLVAINECFFVGYIAHSAARDS